MTNPLEPNYKKDVGRLVTDRYDFEKHLNGTDFRHNATQIDLFPTVVIDGNPKTNVQDAIKTLADIIYTPSLPEATTTSLGVIQLSGDISGTAYNVSVTKIQGKPISTLVPTSGQVLTWNGAFWSPSDPINIFNAGLDLDGNNVAQRVIQISGNNLGEVTVPASTFTFLENSSPEFKQEDATAGNAVDFSITAQNALAGNGGNVLISGGNGLGGIGGGVTLSLDGNHSKMVQASRVTSSRRIVALCGETTITSTEVPDGDLMVYVRDTMSPPVAAHPVGGTLLYSIAGQLHVHESTGNDFTIGSIPNPSIWGDSTNKTYTYRSLNTTAAGAISGENAFVYTIPNNSAVKVDVIMVGKEVHATNNNTLQLNMCVGYTSDNFGTVDIAGAVTPYDTRSTAGAAGWTTPNISVAGNVINVTTGYDAAADINWVTVVQLTIVQG